MRGVSFSVQNVDIRECMSVIIKWAVTKVVNSGLV